MLLTPIINIVYNSHVSNGTLTYGADWLVTATFVQGFFPLKKGPISYPSCRNVRIDDLNNPSRAIFCWLKIEWEKYFVTIKFRA
jgi:hypothetical protein